MKLECDCGYVASGGDERALIATARVHAWEVHRTELADETIVALAGARSTELAPEPADGTPAA